jgi:hypothetical protein
MVNNILLLGFAAFFLYDPFSTEGIHSLNILRLLLLAAPSAPRPTFIPALSISGTGAIPLRHLCKTYVIQRGGYLYD